MTAMTALVQEAATTLAVVTAVMAVAGHRSEGRIRIHALQSAAVAVLAAALASSRAEPGLAVLAGASALKPWLVRRAIRGLAERLKTRGVAAPPLRGLAVLAGAGILAAFAIRTGARLDASSAAPGIAGAALTLVLTGILTAAGRTRSSALFGLLVIDNGVTLAGLAVSHRVLAAVPLALAFSAIPAALLLVLRSSEVASGLATVEAERLRGQLR